MRVDLYQSLLAKLGGQFHFISPYPNREVTVIFNLLPLAFFDFVDSASVATVCLNVLG